MGGTMTFVSEVAVFVLVGRRFDVLAAVMGKRLHEADALRFPVRGRKPTELENLADVRSVCGRRSCGDCQGADQRSGQRMQSNIVRCADRCCPLRPGDQMPEGEAGVWASQFSIIINTSAEFSKTYGRSPEAMTPTRLEAVTQLFAVVQELET